MFNCKKKKRNIIQNENHKIYVGKLYEENKKIHAVLEKLQTSKLMNLKNNLTAK